MRPEQRPQSEARVGAARAGEAGRQDDDQRQEAVEGSREGPEAESLSSRRIGGEEWTRVCV